MKLIPPLHDYIESGQSVEKAEPIPRFDNHRFPRLVGWLGCQRLGGLNDQYPRPPLSKVEGAEHSRLGAFGIHNHEVDIQPLPPGVGQYLVEPQRWNRDVLHLSLIHISEPTRPY